MSAWRSFRHRLELSGLRFLAWLIRRLPRTGVPVAGRILGSLAYRLDFRGRPIALENLRFALGPAIRPDVAARLAEESYQALAQNFLMLFWAGNITAENWREHCDVVFDDEATLEIALKEPVIMLTPHYQNFEMSSLIAGLAVRPMHIVAQDFKNRQLMEFFAAHRRHISHQIVSSDGALLKLFRALSQGGVTGLLVDLAMFPDTNAVPIQCFGHPICVSSLPAELSRRTKAAILPALSTIAPDGRTKLRFLQHFHPGDLSNPECAQKIWDSFETVIREDPVGWLWMYKQWRYRPSDADEPYPSYSFSRHRFDVITNEDWSWEERLVRLRHIQSLPKGKKRKNRRPTPPAPPFE